MTKKIVLAVLAVTLVIGSWLAYGYANGGGCCGKPPEACCGKCGGDLSKCPVK